MLHRRATEVVVEALLGEVQEKRVAARRELDVPRCGAAGLPLRIDADSLAEFRGVEAIAVRPSHDVAPQDRRVVRLIPSLVRAPEDVVATVFGVKCISGIFAYPGLLISDHCVEYDEQLAHACGERDFAGFAGGFEALVEVSDDGVASRGG